MQNTIIHQLLSNAHANPVQPLAYPGQLPPFYILGMVFYAVGYSFGQFGSALLVMIPHSFLCTCFLAEHETLKSS